MIFDLQKKKHSAFVSRFPNKSVFIEQFREQFNYIRAYHATNLSDKEIIDVKENGLKIPDKEFIIQKALLRFSKPEDVETLTKSIAIIAEEYFNTVDYALEQEIFFGLLKAPFIDKWYHYLLLGSEKLLPLADRLCRKHFINFRQRMRDSGKHYIIQATIPLDLVSDCWIESIFEYVNEDSDEANLILGKPLKAQYIQIDRIKRPCDPNGYAIAC